LKEGDEIHYVDGVAVDTLLKMNLATSGLAAGQKVELRFARPQTPGGPALPSREVVVVEAEFDEDLGTASIGLDPNRPYQEEASFPLDFSVAPGVYIEEVIKDSPAEKAGLLAGDRILSIQTGEQVKEIRWIFEMPDTVRAAKGKEQELTIERGQEKIAVKVTAKRKEDKENAPFQIGIQPRQGWVDRVAPESEAWRKGLRPGHRIFFSEELADDQRVLLGFGDPKKKEPEFKAELTKQEGVNSGLVYTVRKTKMVQVQAENFSDALSRAWEDLRFTSGKVYVFLYGLLAGRVGMRTISGPIGIGKIIHSVAAEKPLSFYLWFLAFISVNLGMLQFVPIPLLDGWHLVTILIEKLKGGPIAPKVQEVFQYIGLFIILALVLVATRNDLLRFFTF
jgi:regulator of sigma E protease